MYKNKNGQSSTEFLTLTGILLFMLIVMMAVISDNVSDMYRKEDVIRGEDLVIKVQKEINLAARASDGYSRTFKLPEKLGRKDYSIYILENEAVVKTDGQDFSRSVPEIIGNIYKGVNVINKTNGIISLNIGQIGEVDPVICQNANPDLCSGLNIAFWEGYRESCCSNYNVCCED